MNKLAQQTLLSFLGSSPPPSKRKRRTSTPSSKDTDSDVGAIHFEPQLVDISDEDHSPRRPKRSKNLAGAHATITIASDESTEDVVPRHRKGKNKIVLDSEDDTRPRKRKLIKGIRPPTPEEDEDEDEDILETQNLLENRLRSRGKMTAYQRNLKKLKLLKGKKRGEIVLESSSEDEESESSANVPFKGAKPHHSGASDTSDDESYGSQGSEDDFIVHDDVDGDPPAQLPLAFSLSTHQDLTHHFKIVCQLFVHMAVRPLVDRRPFLEHALKEEEYLSVPLQVTRRKLSGMRDSLVASSVWRSDFKSALETYPNFSLVGLDFAIPQCDACHLGGRLSTFLGRLSGQKYDAYDFEDVSDDESDESAEEDEDDGERDVKREFHLGRFCAARTRVYHQFSHWEYALYRSLQREILEAQDGARQFVKVAYVGGIRPPRDLHDADRVMEWLDERGIIDMEWQKVREMMEGARNLDRGEVDDSLL